MSTSSDNCSIHDIHDHHNTLLDRVWSRLTNASHNNDVTSDSTIKQAILNEQRRIEIQNQARRSADIHRMIMRSVL